VNRYTVQGWELLRADYWRTLETVQALRVDGCATCSPEMVRARSDVFNAKRALRRYELRLDYPHVFGLEA
jgi:hypothetical protein